MRGEDGRRTPRHRQARRRPRPSRPHQRSAYAGAVRSRQDERPGRRRHPVHAGARRRGRNAGQADDHQHRRRAGRGALRHGLPLDLRAADLHHRAGRRAHRGGDGRAHPRAADAHPHSGDLRRRGRRHVVGKRMTTRTTRRWFPVLALVAVATMVNYLDRTVLGIAAPYLTKELALDAAAMGIVFSAFSWSYALLQIPGGIFLDRFGTRVTYSLALTLWSAFTAVMGVISTLPMLLFTRVGVGVFEAPCFPA